MMNNLTKAELRAKAKKNHIRMEPAEKAVNAVSVIVCLLLLAVSLFPILNLVATAFSRGSAEVSGRVYVWPVGFQTEGVKTIMKGTSFFHSMLNTILLTIVGVAVSITVTTLFAYPMSKTHLKGRKILTVLCVVNMVFSGGIIPSYIVVKSLGLLNSYWSIILPSGMSVFNMLIIKNYFEGLPEEVMESAAVDGSGDLRTLVRIVVPMSVPVLATISLLYAISYWNGYFNVIMYISKSDMTTLQVFIRNLIADTGTVTEQVDRSPETLGLLSSGVIVAGVTVLGLIPIVAVYPLVQKFMVQGITVGSVKG